jgi:hypothetical protein
VCKTFNVRKMLECFYSSLLITAHYNSSLLQSFENYQQKRFMTLGCLGQCCKTNTLACLKIRKLWKKSFNKVGPSKTFNVRNKLECVSQASFLSLVKHTP